MSFRSLLIKASLGKVPALKGPMDDLYTRARAFAETGPDSDAGDEAGAQLVLAAHELVSAARHMRALRSTEAQAKRDE